MKSADLTSSYYALFDLPISFDVNLNELAERYRTLQKTVHPDRFASAAESERRLSVQMAARINEGFQILKDPLERGRYLLKLRGIDLNDMDTGFDDEFLMEQMELRERLGSVKENDDSHQVLNTIVSEISKKSGEITRELGSLFTENSDEALEKARNLLRQLQFFRRLEEESDELNAELENY